MVNVRYYGLCFIIAMLALSAWVFHDIQQHKTELAHWKIIKKERQLAVKKSRKNNALIRSDNTSMDWVSIKKEEIFLAIIHAIEKRGFDIQWFQPIEKNFIGRAKSESFKMVIEGSINQLAYLLNDLISQEFPLMIEQLSFQSKDNGAIQVEIAAKIACIRLKKESITLTSSDLTNQKSINFVNQFKLIGTAHNQYHYMAMIQSPSGMSKWVSVGDVIGKEQANIITITDHSLIAQSGKHQWIIH